MSKQPFRKTNKFTPPVEGETEYVAFVGGGAKTLTFSQTFPTLTHGEIKQLARIIEEEVVGGQENSEGNKPHGDVRNQLRASQRAALKKLMEVE